MHLQPRETGGEIFFQALNTLVFNLLVFNSHAS